MSDEADEKISTSFAAQMHFFYRYYGITFFIFSQVGMALYVVARMSNDYILGEWAYKPDK